MRDGKYSLKLVFFFLVGGFHMLPVIVFILENYAHSALHCMCLHQQLYGVCD